jgi:hypothetical protein
METKICCRCKLDKELSEFSKHKKSKDGLRYECNVCHSLDSKKYYNENIEKSLKRSKDNHLKSIKKDNERSRLWNKNNSEKLSELRKLNINKKRDYDKKYQIINKEKKAIYQKIYREKNREKINQRELNRKKTEPLYKLTHNVRNRISKFIKSKGITKKNKTFNIVGCSSEFLKEHIEKQFTNGMEWDLIWKDIHIDHIIPLSSAKTEEEIYKLCHYTNLQPLWAKDNLRKGDKLDYTKI